MLIYGLTFPSVLKFIWKMEHRSYFSYALRQESSHITMSISMYLINITILLEKNCLKSRNTHLCKSFLFNIQKFGKISVVIFLKWNIISIKKKIRLILYSLYKIMYFVRICFGEELFRPTYMQSSWTSQNVEKNVLLFLFF